MQTQTAEELKSKKCVACEGNLPRLSLEEARRQLKALEGWQLDEQTHRIHKPWKMKNFMAAMRFFNQVAELAQREGHHPDLHLENYRQVSIVIWTHAIGGLSENDFILAAKIDRLSAET